MSKSFSSVGVKTTVFKFLNKSELSQSQPVFLKPNLIFTVLASDQIMRVRLVRAEQVMSLTGYCEKLVDMTANNTL